MATRYYKKIITPDEPFWSLRRILAAVRQWVYFQTREPPIDMPFWKTVRYHQRRRASHDAGYY